MGVRGFLKFFVPFGRSRQDVTTYNGHFTAYSFLCCCAALSGGWLFGYDLGVAGGVSTMPPFSKKFFPSVYESSHGVHKYASASPWCAYDNQVLNLFNSAIYLSAMVAALIGSQTAHTYGRKLSMVCAGACYLIGSILNAAAQDIAMLIIGRIFLGAGIGFANSSVTIYANEFSPSKLRGALNLMFQLSTCVGLLVAQIINYFVADMGNGWRISLGMAGAPAIVILIAGLTLPESPTSLIERNRLDEGRRVLQRVRGHGVDISAEFNAIYKETREAAQTRFPLKKILKLDACYVPHLITSLFITAGQQLTGMNGILFYSPQLFSTIGGSGNNAALLNAVVIGAVLVGGTFVAIFYVDNAGRRFFYIYSGIALGVLEIFCGALINKYFKMDGNKLNSHHSSIVLVVICLFVLHYAFSYGPLGWLVTSEIQPAEIRTAGMSVATANNMLWTFIIGQFFLTLLCHMESGVFYLFASLCFVQAAYFYFMLPETRHMHIEEVHHAFNTHPVWKRFPAVPNRSDIEDPVATDDEPKIPAPGLSASAPASISEAPQV